MVLTLARSMVGASAPPSALSLERTGVSKPHSEQYTSCIVSPPWRPCLSALNMNSREWTPRRSAVHILIYVANQHLQKSKGTTPENGSPVNKLRILATTFTWYRKADHLCPTHACLLKIVADEDLIESEVFIFGDVPQICPQVSFEIIEEFRGGLKFAAGLQHNGHEGAAGLWSGGGTYREEGYVLVSDWHGLSCCYVEGHGYNRMSIGWRTKLYRISDLRQSGY